MMHYCTHNTLWVTQKGLHLEEEVENEDFIAVSSDEGFKSD